MSLDRNPQERQMLDESMVRCLRAQAEAIWPQEREVFARHPPRRDGRVLDLACGTGEITLRLAELFEDATVVGVDLAEPHLDLARERAAERGLADRVEFRAGDAFELAFDDGFFDLTVCRHLLQAVPDPPLVLREMKRVTRPGGRLHVVAEDYGMMHFDTPGIDNDMFWHLGPVRFAASLDTDLLSGRRVQRFMRQLGLEQIRVDWVHVDTQRVPRSIFRDIWVAWRDGFAQPISENSDYTLEQVRGHFDSMIEVLADERRFAVWHVPVWTALNPG